MTSFFSKKCEYGLQAVLYLGAMEDHFTCSADDISNKLNIPKEFTSKILQSLTDSGLLESRKGKAGGFRLIPKSDKIKLIDVVEAIDGLAIFNNCVMGFNNCTKDKKCLMHNEWQVILNRAFDMLSKETIDQFKERMLQQVNEEL